MNLKLKSRLSQSGKRQYQIAREVGLTENELSRIVRGRRPASAEERRLLCQALGASERELFGIDPPLSLAVIREADSGQLPPDTGREEVPVAGAKVASRR